MEVLRQEHGERQEESAAKKNRPEGRPLQVRVGDGRRRFRFTEVLPRTIFFALQPLTRAPCSAASEFTHLRGALCGAKTNRINRSLLLLNLPLARIPLPQVQFQN